MTSSKITNKPKNIGFTVLEPTNPKDVRSFKYVNSYRKLLLKKKDLILTRLENIVKSYLPKTLQVEQDLELLKSNAGSLGIFFKHNGIIYKYSFFVGPNPHFIYSIWIPSTQKTVLKELPPFAKQLKDHLPKIQQSLFTQLGLNSNPIIKGKSYVSLPSKDFYGRIVKWTTKI